MDSAEKKEAREVTEVEQHLYDLGLYNDPAAIYPSWQGIQNLADSLRIPCSSVQIPSPEYKNGQGIRKFQQGSCSENAFHRNGSCRTFRIHCQLGQKFSRSVLQDHARNILNSFQDNSPQYAFEKTKSLWNWNYSLRKVLRILIRFELVSKIL